MSSPVTYSLRVSHANQQSFYFFLNIVHCSKRILFIFIFSAHMLHNPPIIFTINTSLYCLCAHTAGIQQHIWWVTSCKEGKCSYRPTQNGTFRMTSFQWIIGTEIEQHLDKGHMFSRWCVHKKGFINNEIFFWSFFKPLSFPQLLLFQPLLLPGSSVVTVVFFWLYNCLRSQMILLTEIYVCTLLFLFSSIQSGQSNGQEYKIMLWKHKDNNWYFQA